MKAFIFDLDGTLYQDARFHRRYLRSLFEGSRWEERIPEIVNGTDALLSGKLPFRLGDFWPVNPSDRAETVDELFRIPRAENRREIFENLLSETQYLYAGDAWSAIRVIAARAGIGEEHRMRCFGEVRQEMLTPEYEIESDGELYDTLGRLSRKAATYLFTNTAREAAETFTNHLGLFDKIGTIEYAKAKPYGFSAILPEIIKQTGADITEIISVGDHSFNDLTPLWKVGGQTLLVSPYEIYDGMPWTYRMKSLSELNRYLKQFI